MQFKDPTMTTIDTASFGVLVASVVGWLPNVAALLTVVWLTLRIIQTLTEMKDARDRKKKGM